MFPRAMILHADGTNRDLDAARAFDLAGATSEVVHLNQLRARERHWSDYELLAIPGGFSYADTLGAGKMLALDLRIYFADEMREFIASGKPVIGICNGFQALVKAGLLPGLAPHPVRSDADQARPAGGLARGGDAQATLTFNANGHFECRWVTLASQSQTCVWTRGMADLIECPVAHGEGQFVQRDPATLEQLRANQQIALTYVRSDGSPALGEYPFNPNGSLADIAGICNAQGNVLGLMPHPENHITATQHPRWTRGQHGHLGLRLFENGVRAVAGSR